MNALTNIYNQDIKSCTQSIKNIKRDMSKISKEIDYKVDCLDDRGSSMDLSDMHYLVDKNDELLSQLERMLSLLN